MKRHQLSDISRSCDLAAGPRGQVAGPVGLRYIGFKKGRFAEQEVGLVRQRGQGSAVSLGIGKVGCIDQFLAGRDGQEQGGQFFRLPAAMVRQPDQRLIIASADKLLQFIQPGTGS